MKLVVDENIPLAEEFFSGFGEVCFRPGRLMTNDDVKDADALIVRSVTQVNEALLAGSSIKFVGSATIGADHLDTLYLDSMGIGYSTAPGCNATAVVEYVAAALLNLEMQRGESFQGKTLGIVGLGNVGSRLKIAFENWGLEVIACDPILESQGQQGLVDLEQVLKADIVSLHTPLTRSGPYPTFHLLDEEQLQSLKPGAILINASRGGVINNESLNRVLEDRGDLSVVLDVWEGEPLIDIELAQRVDIATPHIAGYSYDGKVKGTAQIYDAFCQSIGQQPSLKLEDLIPESSQVVLNLADPGIDSCKALVGKVYAIEEDDLNLRSSLRHEKDHRIAAFDQLRKHYRLRREFSQVELQGGEEFVARIADNERQKIAALGFKLPSA